MTNTEKDSTGIPPCLVESQYYYMAIRIGCGNLRHASVRECNCPAGDSYELQTRLSFKHGLRGHSDGVRFERRWPGTG